MLLEEYRDLADYCVKEARRLGAEYAEARVHGGTGTGFLLKNGEPQPSMIEDSFGIAVRVIAGGAMGFSATNLLSKEKVRDIPAKTVRMAKSSARVVKEPIAMGDSKSSARKVRVEEKEPVEGADPNWLKSVLLEIDKRVVALQAGAGVKIPNRIMVASAGVEEKYIVTSDGARVESRVPRFNFFGIFTAMKGGDAAQRTLQQGETGGLEIVRRIRLLELVEAEARTLTEVLMEAEKAPTGIMDVVLSPELSGIAAHESVGHPQEADRILGREGAQAGESYLSKDSLGMKVGSEEANVSDDPTLAHSNGYAPVDDEGVVAKKRHLIVNGKVTEFLQNRATSSLLGVRNNGSSRSAAFDREPIIRMSNTFVEPGDYATTEELLKEVKDGIYLKSFTEWNIDDKRLNQRYTGLEAYLIKNGETTKLVRAPVLEITTPALWGSVKGRSKRLEFEAANCGKGDPMQGIPVWTGGPDTLLAGVRIAGGS
ncbi:MAG TPA: TldD/PmbA family protein [Nitrososphaerales archaeon]|nr:TldD/PmbA family protein [Nitrososphaerales archaeon]